MTNKSYKELFKEFKEDDFNAIQHEVQDEIYRKFILDLSNNKFTKIEDITRVAKKIKKDIIKYDVDRWYA